MLLLGQETLMKSIRCAQRSYQAALILSVAACSSSSGIKPQSLPFVANDQIVFGEGDEYEIKILNYSGACSIEQADDSHVSGSEYIELDFSEPIAVGTYSVGGDLLIELHQRNGTCDLATDASATAGTVTITSVSSVGVQGNFSADIPGYGTVASTISASFCDVSTTSGPTQCLAPGEPPSGYSGTGDGGSIYDASGGSDDASSDDADTLDANDGGEDSGESQECDDPEYPVLCPGVGGAPAACYTPGIVCSTVTTCNGVSYGCTSTKLAFDCAVMMCASATSCIAPNLATSTNPFTAGVYDIVDYNIAFECSNSGDCCTGGVCVYDIEPAPTPGDGFCYAECAAGADCTTGCCGSAGYCIPADDPGECVP
jgi:hypothetical protein